MRKKSNLTIVERAMVLVPEFKARALRLEHQVVLRGQSQSTLNNYIRRIALFVIHFEKLPEHVIEDEINEYLVALARDPKAPSRSSFKHMVYGLRYYYRLLGMNKKAIALPSLKQDTKLPVVLNRQELKMLFAAPTLLKHRIILTLIYSAGLRGQEVINLKISDIDFERMVIHIRQSKYKKDRIVPLSSTMVIGLRKYLSAEHPLVWLFNGKEPDGRYSVKGLSWVMRENLKKTSIVKSVNLHSLRHSGVYSARRNNAFIGAGIKHCNPKGSSGPCGHLNDHDLSSRSPVSAHQSSQPFRHFVWESIAKTSMSWLTLSANLENACCRAGSYRLSKSKYFTTLYSAVRRLWVAMNRSVIIAGSYTTAITAVVTGIAPSAREPNRRFGLKS